MRHAIVRPVRASQASALLLVILTSGCTLLPAPRETARNTFVLPPEPAAPAPAGPCPARNATLLVNVPREEPGFDTPRLAYLLLPNVLSYYADSRWVDTPGRMMAPLLVLAMEGSGCWRAVVRAPNTTDSDFRLDTEDLVLEQELLPVVVVMAVRLNRPPSQLLMPMVFASHAGSILALTGSPVNVLVSQASEEAGTGYFGFFEFAIVGVPLLAGTMAILVFLGNRLLPHKSGASMPTDLSKHARTLVEQYRLEAELDSLIDDAVRKWDSDAPAPETAEGSGYRAELRKEILSVATHPAYREVAAVPGARRELSFVYLTGPERGWQGALDLLEI